MAELVRCSSCGASLRSDAQWCGQCSVAIPREALVTDEEPAVRRHVPQPVTPAAPQEFSRWRKTDTSFGPFGRLLITFVMVMIGALFVWSMNPFAFVPWLVIAMPLVLRSVWAKKRVI